MSILKNTDYNRDQSFQEVIVVEGMHDLSLIKDVYPNADVLITNGSEISLATLNELKLINEKRGLILFMDPDMQGERIRRIINDAIGDTKHAYVRKKDAISSNKKKVGVEHVPKIQIVEALNNVLSVKEKKEPSIQRKDLYELGLIGNPQAKQNREFLGEKIGIGLNNGKTLYRKLCMFGIKKEDIRKVLRGE